MPPSPPYIPANLTGGPQERIDRIVIHGTVKPGTYCGAAKDLGAYFRDLQEPSDSEGRWASCHYGVDPCETYQYVYDHTIAYHAPPNDGSIGVELCDPQSGPDARWDDEQHQAMLDRAAELVRQLCRAYDIPMVWLYPDDLTAGGRGITDHENVGLAWGQTSHIDPGWSTSRSDDFIRRVLTEESDVSYDDAARAVRDVLTEKTHQSRVPGSDVTFSLTDSILDTNRFAYDLFSADGSGAMSTEQLRQVVRDEVANGLGAGYEQAADAIALRVGQRIVGGGSDES
ncbi:N-acetylmuramoyl-L-alanine amidase [Actinopolyspora alba]|uniref:N-acetylmuramoyl-L-alanine amidase n=1 Tax=Actinopolyspora alba TaxID=673379 RepID=A0A1I2BE50_9ACTN|nr:peptidoglycan recognition family protein [Actinopolyspora alba]SFE54444.1 N-acetylmuramoyl-L-alanine amidase [Actinopolyspora alba]